MDPTPSERAAVAVDFDAAKLFSVKGLVCVVTGGGTGIGLMIATALEHNGAEKVFIIGRRKEVLENAAKMNNKFGKLIPVVADVTSKSDLQSAVSRIQKEVGYLNLLVCNSGILGPNHNPLFYHPDQYATISSVRSFLWDNFDPESWEKTFAVNVTGVWLCSVAFLELLEEGNKKQLVRQKSQIVCVTSIGAYHRNVTSGFAHSASKAGVHHMMKVMATFLTRYNIRVNIIAPGLYPSALSVPEELKDNPLDERNSSASLMKELKVPKTKVPEERPGREEEMAGTILYLASEAGGFCNGNIVVTDGGSLCILPASY